MRGVHWFRNDLRLQDNTALRALAERADEWLPIFVLDPRLDAGTSRSGPRKRFLLDCLARLGRDLDTRGVPLIVREGRPEEILPELMHRSGARLLSFNDDVTPFARARDARVERAVESDGGEVIRRLDHVVFDASEVRSASGKAYSVYTPFRKRWWQRWNEEPRLASVPTRLLRPIPGFEGDAIPDVEKRGVAIEPCEIPTGGERAARRRLDAFLESAAARYHEDRDRPDLDGTSRLSPYLRFGAISIRRCIERAIETAMEDPSRRQGITKWMDELIWREFYSAILEENPRVLRESQRPEYDNLVWNDDPVEFEAWCEGRTGYPIVDAGMRQLRATGWMHNRVRMIVASFLTKDLLIDWHAGERFFFDHLVDGDPASNNGGWQWAASTGTDAQPYFRIFNPALQAKRWDPDGRYIRRWIPELRDVPAPLVHEPRVASLLHDYPPPIVDHAERRKLALDRYKLARASHVG